MTPEADGRVRLRTRWDDCDRFGHVNNAAYLALIREATDRVMQRPTLELARIEIEFRRPLLPNADVEIAVEADAERDGMLAARYRVDHDGRTHASATAEWRVDPGVASPSLPALERDLRGRPFAWSQAVRSFELGPDGNLRPAAVLQWFEYAVYRAAQLVGWTPSRMREADFVTLQIGHFLAIRTRVDTGEDLAIVSRIVEMRRVSGTWHHEARRSDGTVVAADRSRGAFLDDAGNVRRPPEEMITALLGGEPGR